jgi:transposase
VLSVEDWAEIRRLRVSEKMPIKVIARTVGCSKNTVKKALGETGPPAYRRAPSGSIVDVVDPRIRELLAAWPTMPATVIAERVGWDHGLTVLKDRVRELRPIYLPPDPASRTAYLPGEVAQCDFWFPDIELPVGFGQTRTAKRLPVLTMVCGYCRWLSARLIPSRTSQDLFAGWWTLIAQLGAVPRLLVWDGEAAIGRWRRGVSELTADTQAFRGVLGTSVKICKPADPEAKGLVERGNGYLETSFLPGRTFTGPDDFNNQLGVWLALANSRVKRALGCAPTERVDADRQAMLALPPVPPQVGWSQTLRLPRDHYVRLDSNDYSVHPAAIGRRVQVSADLDRVRVVCDGQPVADHARVWARHHTISDPAHVEAAKRQQQQRLIVVPPPAQTQVEQRALSDYDDMFGLNQDAL